MTLLIASVLFALAVSCLCSLAEATLLSLTPAQVADLSQRNPRVGSIWSRFKADIDRPIAAILLINTTAHTVGASVAGAQWDQEFGNKWVWAFSLVFTFLMLQFTEILPKSLGVRFNRRLAMIIGGPLRATTAALVPIIRLVGWINRPFEGRRAESARPATVEELAALAGLARLTKQIGAHQEQIIRAAPRLSKMNLRQVMIPIEDVSFLSTSQSLFDAVAAAHVDAHTRFPVCEGDDRTNIIGYVTFKEMIYYMRTNPRDPSLRGIIRPIHFACVSDTPADLLKLFISQHVHIAIVRDEAGRAVGLITLEDLVEELIGEVEDEFDRLPRAIHELSGGVFMVGGGALMSELADRIGLQVEDKHGSVSSWMQRRLGRPIKAGDTLREGDWEFLVRRTRRGHTYEVSVIKAPPPDDESTPPTAAVD